MGFCCGGVAGHHVMMKYPEFRAGVSIYGKSALYTFTQWDQEEWMKDNHNHKPLPKPGVLGTMQNPGIVRDSEDMHSLKNPTLFIFAENDAMIPLEQVVLLTPKLKECCQVEYQI